MLALHLIAPETPDFLVLILVCFIAIIALFEGETMFRVVHPFTARQAGQLSLERGRTVVVFEAADNGWWRGREVATDRMGWFPGTYVQELQNGSPSLFSGFSCNTNLVITALLDGRMAGEIKQVK